MSYTKSLAAITQNELETVGRKAMDLALLREGKFLVPEGFVVSSAALEAVLADNQLVPKIDFLLSHAQSQSPQGLMNAYSGVRKALTEAKMPERVEAELKEMYESLAGRAPKRRRVRIIVSTNRIDDPESNDTVIQSIETPEEFLLGVREAWALAYVPSQLRHRIEEKYPEKQLRIALIAQAMEEASVRVHAHSALPQDHDRIYLETYYGELDLREKVVKDYYAIMKETLVVAAHELNTQPSKLEVHSGALALVPMASRPGDEKLNRRELEEVGRLVKKAERTLHSPIKAFFSAEPERHTLLWVNRLGFDIPLPHAAPESEPSAHASPPVRAQPEPPQATATHAAPAVEIVDIVESHQEDDIPTLGEQRPPAEERFAQAEHAAERAIEEMATQAQKSEAEATVAASAHPSGNVNARLLAVSLRLAMRAIEKRHVQVYGETGDSFSGMIGRLNSAHAFPRELDATLLGKAHDAVEKNAALADDEYAHVVEEIAYVLGSS